MIVGISEIHHSHSNDDTADRVRGAQEGRVRDKNGSAGDFCYGYASEFEDPVAAAAYRGRGPKPKRIVVINSAAASVVHEIFTRFAIKEESISAIVRWWEEHKNEFPKIGRSRIHHEHVRRILTNKKYIGIWTFGATTTLYDGHGNKKQVSALPNQIVTVERPDLRIIEQELWDKAQARLAELKDVYGMKPDGKKRGPAQHYRLLYEKSLLGGLVTCGSCGARLIVQRGGVKRLACPNHKVGKCSMAAGVPYHEAEQGVLELIAHLLKSYPHWLQSTVDATRRRLEQLAQSMPNDLAQAKGQLNDACNQSNRLVDTLASGVDSPTIRARLSQLEAQKSTLESRVIQLEQVRTAQMEMPEDQWIRDELNGMTDLLKQEMSTVAPSLRPLLGKIVAESVLPPGKKRGYVRLRVTIAGWAVMSQLLGERLPASMLANLKPADDARSQEFVLDLGAPTRMDQWGPQIVQWRQQKVKWKEICRRTGLKLANAFIAYKRCKGADQAT